MNEDKLTNKTILVVDDESDLRDIIASELEFLGAKVFTSENITHAKRILEKNKIDLVISDIRMPGGTGIDLLEHVKTKLSVSLPVLLITGFADITEEQAYSLGAEALIHKPFKLDDLVDIVERFSMGPLERFESNFQSTSHHNIKATSQFKIGRGGVAIELMNRPNNFAIGQIIAMDAVEMKASGVVRWIRSKGIEAEHTWIGVEFTKIDELGTAKVLENIESNTLSFIPSSQA